MLVHVTYYLWAVMYITCLFLRYGFFPVMGSARSQAARIREVRMSALGILRYMYETTTHSNVSIRSPPTTNSLASSDTSACFLKEEMENTKNTNRRH